MRLITTLQELQRYVPVSNTFGMQKISPHIDRVTRTYILKLIGSELLNEFLTAYEAAKLALDGKPDAERKAIEKAGAIYTLMPEKYREPMVFLQDAIANISFMNCLSQMQANIDNEGIRLAVNENQKTAFQWQVDDMKFQMGSDGYGALDNLLAYLEDNVEEFEAWTTSDSYFEQKQFFVETADIFNRAYYISHNRMTYLTLRYIMQRIEQFDVRRAITPAVYAKLKASQQTGYSAKEKILMQDFLIPGIVLITVAKGIVERAIEVSDLGVQANLYTYYVTLKDARRKNAFEADKDKMVSQLLADGGEFLQEARKFIEANADEFGAIEETENPMNFRVINKPERKIFGM